MLAESPRGSGGKLSNAMRTNSYADPTTEKRRAYDAATALLGEQDDDSLRYATLELRRCIEAIVYEKLKVYGNLLPEGSVHQWQPPQALDALIAIEPDAETTFTYAIAPQTHPAKMPGEPLKPIGVDERPKAKWVKKTWQKLGFYLHADWPFAADKPKASPRPFLEKTLSDLAPLVNSAFSAMMAMTTEFMCSGCGLTVKVMTSAVEKSREAVCLMCGMRYRAEESNGDFTFFEEQPPFTCECGTATFVPPKELKIGHKFSCRSCSQTFEIVAVDWKYTVCEDGGSSGSEEE
jgi:hypothetical protein